MFCYNLKNMIIFAFRTLNTNHKQINSMENNKELIAQCEQAAKQWLSPSFDEETRKEVQAMLDNPDKSELIDSFYRSLEFGTGGLRGIMGAGTNRMNVYIVGMATQGFANYILKAFPGKKDLSVVVGHDCRNHGRQFAETVANIFSANGIKAYLFESLRPTPEISFRRHLGTGAQIPGAMAHLDCRRCRHLRALFLQGHSLQGQPLRPLRHHRHLRLLRVEATDERRGGVRTSVHCDR